MGEAAVVPSMEFFGDLDFWWIVQRGNHVRTMLGAWACRRREGFGCSSASSTVACSALVVGGTDTSRRTGPQLVLFPVPHFRELGMESLKLDLPSVTVRLRGSSCALLSGLDTGVMNQ
ncbi:hypothetical protein Taro_013398 [Colocasia esculenta]|uniref:Uncharacterized protein n=1 Tax=Colocasia esculenta TaxID=4460 RepID=A0A843UBR2_COLES|nr:hypothetical protein [Colocasia esculenta]